MELLKKEHLFKKEGRFFYSVLTENEDKTLTMELKEYKEEDEFPIYELVRGVIGDTTLPTVREVKQEIEKYE
jgi:hypothetical protein